MNLSAFQDITDLKVNPVVQ